MDNDTKYTNIAESLARLLPTAKTIELPIEFGDNVVAVALPPGTTIQEMDFERLMPSPRRAVATATITDADSFIGYVNRHTDPAGSTVVWCQFDPQSFALSFRAVFDDIGPNSEPGWRVHQALYQPAMSHEWKVWVGANGAERAKPQIEFAEFLERNSDDIAEHEGYPTSLQMLEMATNFTVASEKSIKSIVRLQGGGANMTYIDDADTGSLAQMKVFEKFAIGAPVFWLGPKYKIHARLKWRQYQATVKFHYELIRPDRVHAQAAADLIEKISAGIARKSDGTGPGAVMFMGACTGG